MQKAMNFIDIAIVSIKGIDYRTHFLHMRKDDAINLMKSSNLRKLNHYKFFSSYIKMSDKNTYYEGKREKVLNKAKIKIIENNKARNK